MAILTEMRDALRRGEDPRIAEQLVVVDVFIGADLVPDPIFDELVSMLADPALLRAEEGWEVVRLLDERWDYLSAPQKDVLRSLCEGLFVAFDNWMGAFVVGELLGRRFPDRSTLAVFDRLGATARMPERSLVPHGLETLARETPDAQVRERAIAHLRKMCQDSHPDVRAEALQTMELLKRLKLAEC